MLLIAVIGFFVREDGANVPVDIIIGAQWGDEGKGKIVDLLSEDASIVARYQGGANAGHTVIYRGAQYVLHQIPSGIFHRRIRCIIGNGVVVDPEALLQEVRKVESLRINVRGRLFISHRAHLIMPYHKLLDLLAEESADGGRRIGTTGRGIGPAYTDKVARSGIRIVDLLSPARLKEKLTHNLSEKNRLIRRIYGKEELDADAIVAEYVKFDKRIDPFVTDTSLFLSRALREGKVVIAEGAQGALLDVDHGTYPFVTSSNPTAGGACTGLGIPPTSIRTVLGVAKAYTTRVGEGPFPTEDLGTVGETLRLTGGEFGATTGRPRRCGWYDAFAMQYVIRINGIEGLAITKLDVLDRFEEIRICTGYRTNGKTWKSFPTEPEVLSQTVPVYETFPGWRASTRSARSYGELPRNARRYLRALAELSGARLSYVSVGPSRRETIHILP